jgi:serine/threonine-protein kinase
VAADQVLTTLQLEASPLRLDEPQMLSGSVQAGGARLFPIQLPPAGQLVLEVSGSPLLQMALFAADGEVLGAQGPLRLLNLAVPKRSPVQLLLLNQGLAPTWFTLSVRAEPPLWPQADADRDQ